jgi:hypothetical protein
VVNLVFGLPVREIQMSTWILCVTATLCDETNFRTPFSLFSLHKFLFWIADLNIIPALTLCWNVPGDIFCGSVENLSENSSNYLYKPFYCYAFRATQSHLHTLSTVRPCIASSLLDVVKIASIAWHAFFQLL